MKRKMKIKRKNLRKITLVILIVVIATAVMLRQWRYSVKKDQLQHHNHSLISIEGRVLSLSDNLGVKDVSVYVGNQHVVTDSSGSFYLEGVDSEDSLIIRGGHIYEDIEIPIVGRRSVTVWLDDRLFNRIRQFESFEQYRKFRSVYKMMSKQFRLKVSEEDYLNRRNAWWDRFNDKYRSSKVSVYVHRDLNRISDDSVETVVEYTWLSNYDKYSYKTKCMWTLENNDWMISRCEF